VCVCVRGCVPTYAVCTVVFFSLTKRIDDVSVEAFNVATRTVASNYFGKNMSQDVTQRRLVFGYRRFGTAYRSPI
jgi:hypothetical protein